MAPTEAEIRTQWKNAIDILESTRLYADGTALTDLDTLVQSLEGDYTSVDLTAFAARHRAALSAACDESEALAIMTAILFEMGPIMAAGTSTGTGSGFRSVDELFSAFYRWTHENSDSVLTRGITYNSVTNKAGNVGNIDVSRLTVDRYGYNLEACTVEKKMIICTADANSGVNQWAEAYEIMGEAGPFDALNIGSRGSGEAARTTIRAKHAGTGAGGSLLSNSSFSDFTASASSGEQFDGWTETLTGAAASTDITQDTTNYYRSHPNAGTNASCKLSMDSVSDSITLKQTIDNMRVSRLDPDTPYFLRVMWNRSIGSGTSGTIAMKLGGNASVTVAVAAQSGWQELVIPFDKTCWPIEFNQPSFDIEIGWSAGTAGYILFDDMIFCPWDLVDGTYWLMHQSNGTPVASLVDDEFYVDDSGGAPGTGKLQYWCWRSGLGYLPSSGVPTITDP